MLCLVVLNGRLCFTSNFVVLWCLCVGDTAVRPTDRHNGNELAAGKPSQVVFLLAMDSLYKVHTPWMQVNIIRLFVLCVVFPHVQLHLRMLPLVLQSQA